MVMSRKSTLVAEYSYVNFMVGWAELMRSMKLLRLSAEPGQMHSMSSMNLFQSRGAMVEFVRRFSSSSAMKRFA